MRNPALKKVGKRVLQIGLPVAILAIFLYQIHNWDWKVLATHASQWNLWLIGLAFLGFIFQELSFGLIWQAVLARLGSRLDLRTCLRIYLASEFVRYIPGNVWHVLTRILWVGRHGVSRPIVFALSLLFSHDFGAVGALLHGTPVVVVLGVVTMLAVLIGLHPRILNGLLNFALRLLKRDPILLTLRYSDILLVTLAWCLSWLVAGSAFYLLLLALWPSIPIAALPICIGIYAIAWDIGFVSFITPSGLGIREGTIAGLVALALPLPVGLGAILALLSRVVSSVAELLCVSIAYLSGGRQVREVRQEQAARLPLSN